MIDIKKIKELLTSYNEKEVTAYVEYITKSATDKKADGTLTNPFYKDLTSEILAKEFIEVKRQGLVYDGKHITRGKLGVQYDYVAYKNKMLLAYPDSKIDAQLVYKKDIFNVAKESGSVVYSHTIVEPFNRKDDDIIGAYCVIKNTRGEFLTTLTKDELQKHRKIAKTDYIWSKWVVEMSMKTVFKKAVKFHYDDIFEEMEKEDEKNYDLEKLNIEDQDLEIIKKIEDTKTVEELRIVYKENKKKIKDISKFDEAINKQNLIFKNGNI